MIDIAEQRQNALRVLVEEVRSLALGWDNLEEANQVRQAVLTAEDAIASEDAERIDAAGRELFDLKESLQAARDK